MLTFIDESGYPRPTDSTKNPILLGVCIHENDIKPITNQIYKLKDSIYGKQDEIKSTKLIREATITKNRTNNKAYVEGMVDIITSYDAAIFAIIMDKPDEPIIVPEHHLPKQYYLLLKKVEFYLVNADAVTQRLQIVHEVLTFLCLSSILINQRNALCTFVYPAVHLFIPYLYGSTGGCIRSLSID